MAFGTLGNSETSGYAATVSAVKKYWANAHAGNVQGRNKPNVVGSLRRGAVTVVANDSVSNNAKAAKGYSMFVNAAVRKG